MTRAEHLTWCKQQALEYVDRGDVQGAFASMTSDLNKHPGRGNPGTEVEWSHRWLVRGHWRQQWYASEGVHRAIYINPHIKGPEDKPLIVRDKVNILGR